MTTSAATLPDLLTLLRAHSDRDAPVTFTLDGRQIRPGYHVTELKAARIDSIDCGRNRDSWTETALQLTDGDGRGTHMTAARLAGILADCLDALPALAGGRLIVEVSPGGGPLRRATIAAASGALDLTLEDERTACKPAATGSCGCGPGCCAA